MYIVNFRRRAEAVFVIVLIFFIVCLTRLLYIQFFRADYLASIAKKQHNLYIELEPRRGTIYDSNFKPQAVNLAFESVFASPNDMTRAQKDAAELNLSAILKMSAGNLRSKLSRKKSFVWISRKISPEQAQQIKDLQLKGVGFIKESKRCYPNGYLLSHVLGFAGLDNKGLEGVELCYDKYLKGQAGWAVMLRDARRKRLNVYDNSLMPKDGYDIVLTVDEVIQYIAERELEAAFRKYHAKGASIVVMDPRTGAILAMANRPTFDPNDPTSRDKDIRRNRAICDMFEPGSVFKIVTASAALEERKVNEMTPFFCENGEYKIAGRILHDHTSHGTLTFREVIELSSNIGTVKVAHLLGAEMLYRYVKAFGFGTKSGIDIPGEISGSMKPTRQWSKTTITCVPMGQEVGVTALQLVTAVSVVANGGTLMKPYVIKEIRDKTGDMIKYTSPTAVRRVLDEDTAARMKKILIGVVENGTGKLAKLDGFTAAGKTGTAQKVEPGGRYSHSRFMASFIGFAPAEDPQLAIAVTLDEPRGIYYGGVVAGPVFKNVAADSLKYLRTKEYKDGALALYETERAR
ncbi:MAG: penicillin-binding transpeptidase domain-containing protein [Candidatus Omnitrophota bacterium]